MSQVTFELADKEQLLAIRKEYTLTPGVYFLWEGDEIVYVGHSTHTDRRILQHFTEPPHAFGRHWKVTHFSIVSVPLDQLEVVEMLYIHRFQPRYNKHGMRHAPKDE